MISGKGWLAAALLGLLLLKPALAGVDSLYLGQGQWRVLQALCLDAGAPYIFRDQNGELRGFYVDLLAALAEKAQIRMELRCGSFQEASREINLSRLDMVVGTPHPVRPDSGLFGYLQVKNLDPAGGSTASEVGLMMGRLSGKEVQDYCFSMVVAQEPFSLFLRSGEDHSLSSLQGRKVLVVQGSEGEKLLEQHSRAELIQQPNIASVLQSLARGKAEAAFLPTYQAHRLLRTDGALGASLQASGQPLFSSQRGLVVMKGDSALALELLQSLQELQQDGSLQELTEKWLQREMPSPVDARLLLNLSGGALVVLLAVLVWNLMLKRQVRRIVEERERIYDFVRDGIVTVDGQGRITMMNRTARNLLSLGRSDLGSIADEKVPGLEIGAVLADGRPAYNVEQNLNGSLVSCSKAPVLDRGRCNGAIITLRDMTELQALAEEITGAQMYVQSLRVQNHEFMNKLQAISGLIQLGRYDRALEFIAAETDSSHSAQSFMAERIKNAAVCGILMGKAGRCRELDIQFSLDPHSFCSDRGGKISDRSLVIVVGNLLQNAIEAIEERGAAPESKIDFAIFDESGQIIIVVGDNAGLMTDQVASKLFQKGFSTKKKGRASGFGLYNIKSIVDSLGGDIQVDYRPGQFTEFTVTLPAS